MQIIGGREGDRVQQEVQASPGRTNLVKYSLQLSWFAHITRQQQLTAKGGGDRTDMRQRLVVQVGCRQGGALLHERAHTAGGDTRLVGDANA